MWEQDTLKVENQVVNYSMKVFEEPSDTGLTREEFPSSL